MGIKQDVYVGTYTLPIEFGTGQIFEGKGEGIYLYEFDTDSVELKLKSITKADNPSYLAVDSDTAKLYAVNELKVFMGKPSGAVSAFSVREDGSLEPIGQSATGGTDPCHAAISPDGRFLVVSNYSSGSLSVYPIQKDGALGMTAQFIQYEGKSANPERQAGPHAHSATFSKDAKYAYICDLGTDLVRAYRYKDAGTPLSDAGMTDFAAQAGAGPRCCEFSADGRFCYIVNELDSSVSVAAFDKGTGTLGTIQKVSAVPAGAAREGNISADLHITPNGQFLYCSNRGLDNIAIFRIDVDSGLLSFEGFAPCGGKTPRNFAIDATGHYLFCANQDSDNIVVFEIDTSTGQLTKKTDTHVPAPVCVKPLVRRLKRR